MDAGESAQLCVAGLLFSACVVTMVNWPSITQYQHYVVSARLHVKQKHARYVLFFYFFLKRS